MIDPFDRGEAAGRHLKIAVTGPIGSGKTCFGLDAKNHGCGPVAVLSLEAGDVQFQTSKRWGGFKSLRTQSIDALKEAIEFLEQHPGKYGTLVVDTITGIYEAVVDAKMKDDGSMNRNTWGVTKRAWKSLMLRLVNLPLHVVFVVHELDITETNEKTGDTKIVGQKLDAEKTFGRAPDFVLRLTMAGGKPVGEIRKVRGEDTGFVVGQKVPEPHIGMFAAAVKAGAEARIATPEEVREANAGALETAAAAPAAEPTPEEDGKLAAALVKACDAGFRAQLHKENWIKKHRDEIAGLKKRHPDLYATIKAAYDAAHVGAASEPQEAA